MRPAPSVPQARSPVPGCTTRTPRAVSATTFACVAGFSHMPVFIAGATTIGAFVASRVEESRSSAIPCAIFARTFAVAGATTTRSAAASEMCPGFQSRGSSKRSHSTGLRESVWNVSGVTNARACSVITTCTSSPRFTRSRTSSHAL